MRKCLTFMLGLFMVLGSINLPIGAPLRMEVKAAVVKSGGIGPGTSYYEIDQQGDEYKLIIRANTQGGGVGGNALISKSYNNASEWPWDAYRDRISSVEF